VRSVTVQQAKTQLSALLHAVEDGEEIEIRRGSKPVARLVPSSAARTVSELRGIFAIKRAKGKLEWPNDGFQTLLESSFRTLAISPQHAVAAGQLRPHHADPFDRILIAQAEIEGLTVVGSDPAFAGYGIDVIWS
jgi:prevent-host-death family protein